MTDLYASTADVRNALGSIGNRLPAWVDLDVFLGVAHGQVVEELGKVYPAGIPGFAGDGLTVVRWAEAKLAAAEILDGIRINLPDLGDAPDRLRASAMAALDGGVVGYLPGDEYVPGPGDPDAPGIAHTPRPRVSSYTPLSAFPDPYEAARDSGLGFQ